MWPRPPRPTTPIFWPGLSRPAGNGGGAVRERREQRSHARGRTTRCYLVHWHHAPAVRRRRSGGCASGAGLSIPRLAFAENAHTWLRFSVSVSVPFLSMKIQHCEQHTAGVGSGLLPLTVILHGRVGGDAGTQQRGSRVQRQALVQLHGKKGGGGGGGPGRRSQRRPNGCGGGGGYVGVGVWGCRGMGVCGGGGGGGWGGPHALASCAPQLLCTTVETKAQAQRRAGGGRAACSAA